MVGSAKRPMVTTVAPTIPVEAASNMPTKMTAIPSPPFMPRINSSMVVRRFSAIFDFSSIIPMKTNNGTAIKVSLPIMSKIRLGMLCRNAISNAPNILAINAKSSETPASVKATGKPISSAMNITANKSRDNHSITVSLLVCGFHDG